MPRLTAHGLTDTGRVRQNNEDRFLIDRRHGLYAVADGMSGHAAGEVAAETALDTVQRVIRQRWHVIEDARDRSPQDSIVKAVVEAAVQEACSEVYSIASGSAEFRGMGTTLTMLLTADDKGIVAHVGDSRLYLLRNDQLRLLTNDHTVATALSTGDPKLHVANEFTHLLTRSVGEADTVEVDTHVFDLLHGDAFLLCTDGLSKYVDDEEIIAHLRRDRLPQVTRRLIDLANSRGGSDNVTAVVMRVDPKQEITVPSVKRAEIVMPHLVTKWPEAWFPVGYAFCPLSRRVRT